MRFLGFDRHTIDVDILIDVDLENEASVFQSLRYLPDQAVNELAPGDIEKYTVVRIADEIVIDLMKSACGIDYHEAVKDILFREVNGVNIPFASPELLWRMKVNTRREKDQLDLVFLKRLLSDENT